MKKILVVGQTPPPYGGQAMMIRYMLDAEYSQLKLYHVRMCFSKDFSQRGKFSLYKVTHLLTIILNIWKMRWHYGIRTMYYPVSSAPKVALLRDAIILGATRCLFREVVYHFHAAGISEELPQYPPILRRVIYHILKKPALGITSSIHNPKDAAYLQAQREAIVPLGIPDENPDEARRSYGEKPYLTLMFMGLLNGTKGEGFVLDAVHQLNQQGRDVRFVFAGKFEDETFKEKFFEQVKAYGLEEKVDYKGIVAGEDKKRLFLSADVFCFPTFFSSESFGIVLLEGMMYQMPVVASRWRGVQSVVEEGRNGYLVNIKNADEIVAAIQKLYDDRDLLARMAKESRQAFKEKYILSTYLQNMEQVLVNNQ